MVGDPEVKTMQALQTSVVKDENFLERFKRFSKWHTALNVVAQILRLARKDKSSGPITVEERRKAGLVLVRIAQRGAFKEEMQKIKQGKLSHNNQLFHNRRVSSGWEGD